MTFSVDGTINSTGTWCKHNALCLLFLLENQTEISISLLNWADFIRNFWQGTFRASSKTSMQWKQYSRAHCMHIRDMQRLKENLTAENTVFVCMVMEMLYLLRRPSMTIADHIASEDCISEYTAAFRELKNLGLSNWSQLSEEHHEVLNAFAETTYWNSSGKIRKETTKVRIVFHTSSHTFGFLSLKDVVWVETNFNRNILHLLPIFRSYRTRISADIE